MSLNHFEMRILIDFFKEKFKKVELKKREFTELMKVKLPRKYN